jgi:hypothetical protein
MPLFDNDGRKIEPKTFREVRAELVERFGGLTAYTRAPAEGLWATPDSINRDEIVIIEVMVPELDRAWWQALRSDLEKRLRQEVIVIRSYPIELL